MLNWSRRTRKAAELVLLLLFLKLMLSALGLALPQPFPLLVILLEAAALLYLGTRVLRRFRAKTLAIFPG